MLVSPIIRQYSFIFLGWERHFVLPKNTTQCSRPGLEHGPLNLGTNVNWGHRDFYTTQRRVEIHPFASCYRTQDKLQRDEPLFSYSDLTLLYNLKLILVLQRRIFWQFLQNVMSYINNIWKQTMQLWDSSRCRNKIFSTSCKIKFRP